MSVQDIVKYVRQTPGNTNPSVIASMVESEIRQNSSEAGISCGGSIVYHPGNDYESVEEDGTWYKISDYAPTADELDGGVVCIPGVLIDRLVHGENLQTEEELPGACGIFSSNMGCFFLDERAFAEAGFPSAGTWLNPGVYVEDKEIWIVWERK